MGFAEMQKEPWYDQTTVIPWGGAFCLLGKQSGLKVVARAFGMRI
jgi:hypothetical protein